MSHQKKTFDGECLQAQPFPLDQSLCSATRNDCQAGKIFSIEASVSNDTASSSVGLGEQCF